MALKIYNEEPVDEDVFLKLRHGKGTEIDLVAVNSLGARVFGGSILSITRNGEIYRRKSVSPAIGFKLTTDGRVCDTVLD